MAPHDYDGQKLLRTIVWLHGFGQRSDNKTMAPVFQMLADRHHLAFVCVNGSRPAGEGRSAWADVPDEDFQRIEVAIGDADTKIRRKPGLVMLGFSQGGTVGVELVVRHPQVFLGGITISAGTGEELQLDAVADRSRVTGQRFVIVCGAKEADQSIARSEELTEWLEENGAKVLRPSYPDHAEHTFPGDFAARLPEWVQYIEGAAH